MADQNNLILMGTRGSALALAQSGLVRDTLQSLNPAFRFELKIIKTSGDQNNQPKVMPEFGLKGLWTREIEVELAAGRIDIAVHSLKDLPTQLPPGLILGATPKRADPRDVLITRGPRFEELPKGSTIGTASLRRRGQLLALRPDLNIVDLRGNVETRLNKLKANDQWQGIVLAAAGLDRLSLALKDWNFVAHPFEPSQMLPAPCQAILGLETRENDSRIAEILRSINDGRSFQSASAERAFADALNAGCRTPVAGYSEVDGQKLLLRGAVFSEDGHVRYRGEIEGNVQDAAVLGRALGEQAKAHLLSH